MKKLPKGAPVSYPPKSHFQINKKKEKKGGFSRC